MLLANTVIEISYTVFLEKNEMLCSMVRSIKARLKRTYLLSSFCDNYCIVISGKPYYFSCDIKMGDKKSPTPSLCGVSLEYVKPVSEVKNS